MEFLSFRKFNEYTAAKTFSLLLEENGIENILEDSSPKFDPGFSNNELLKEFRIKIKSEDFEQANQLLLNQADALIQDIDENHYLFQYNNDELKELLSKADEWSEIDIRLARKILLSRGIALSESDLMELRKKRIKELAEPERISMLWIRFAYAVAFAGGLIALFIGWHIHTHKKTLPNGESVFAYDMESRKQGLLIYRLGLLMLFVWISVFVIRNILFENNIGMEPRNLFGH
ncbi:MAG: hypothetical protein ACOVP1_13515 [Bacteroidia bacterium]